MAQIKALLDEYGIINKGTKVLPDDEHKLKLLEALAELEDIVFYYEFRINGIIYLVCYT